MNEKEAKEFLEDEKNIASARDLAMQINTEFRSNWFTVDKLAKKAGLEKEEAIAKIYTLSAFGFIKQEKFKKEVKYKVVFKDEDRLVLYKDAKKELESELKYLDEKIETLEKQIKESK